MKEVGAYEAKTNLSQLLQEVAHGQSISITMRGKPIAILMPVQQERPELSSIIAEMRQMRKQVTWGKGMSSVEAKDIGRK